MHDGIEYGGTVWKVRIRFYKVEEGQAKAISSAHYEKEKLN